jgi:hypothetical protein
MAGLSPQCLGQYLDDPCLRRHALGRSLHSFPYPLNLSSLSLLPLNLSSLCPPYDPNQPVEVSQGAQVEL